MSEYSPTPLEQLLGIAVSKRNATIGLPAPLDNDKRFPLTPEAAGMLVERGFTIKIEEGGANRIHYDDYKYQQYGVDIVDRAETLRCDIVISLSELAPSDARGLKRGSMLFTLFDSVIGSQKVMSILLRSHVIAIALDLISDERGHLPFSDILKEISGRASVAIASSLLADAEFGKGILLGGVAGIVPCEVTIIGSGIDACAAARSAIGLGAIVRMFDNDVYRLRAAIRELGPGVSGSALHLNVLVNALRSADVVVATPIKPLHVISSDVVEEMKRGVITFDLGTESQSVFPSMPKVDLGMFSACSRPNDGQRVCYVHPGNAMPRTVAMALSNTLLTMLSEIFACEGFTNALMLNAGLQQAALTFLGKPVNATVAKILGMRQIDIKLMLQFS